MDKQVKKIKIFFVAICVLIVLFVWKGSVVLSESKYFKTSNMSQYLAFLKYKLEFNGLGLPLEADTVSPSYAPKNYSATNINSESIPVIFYRNDFPQTTDATESFRNQMFTLKKSGYQTITAEELYQFMHGTAKIPEKSFVLAFANSKFAFADPILKAIDYKAIMLVGQNSKKINELDQILATGRWDIQKDSSGNNYSIITK